MKWFLIRRGKQFLFIIALITSLLGSYQLYQDSYDSALKTLTVVLYSTFKLFMFSPTNGMTNSAPLLYELAIWIAPAFTMVGFFSLFQKMYQKLRLFWTHRDSESIALLGDNEKTIEFINKNNTNQRYVLLADKNDEIDEDSYLQRNVKIVRLDFNQPDYLGNNYTLKNENPLTKNLLISFEEVPLVYHRLNVLNQMLEEFDPLRVFFDQNDDPNLSLALDQLDSLDKLIISSFDLMDLSILSLIQSKDLSIESNIKPIDKSLTYQELVDRIEPYHFVLTTHETLTFKWITQLVNRYTLNPDKRMKVTLIGDDAESLLSTYRDSIRNLDKVLAFETISDNKQSTYREFFTKNHNINALFLLEDSTQDSISFLHNLVDILSEVPIVLFAEHQQESEFYINGLSNLGLKIHTFGDVGIHLKLDEIVNEPLLNSAKAFNFEYQKIYSELFNEPPSNQSSNDLWKKLSYIKRESSLSQSLHAQTKQVLLNELSVDNTKLLEINNSMEPLSLEEKIKKVENIPWLNYLTALEHTRWNNFYYLRNFVYGSKNEQLKKHDCLIDDWDAFLHGPQRDKVFYDTLSTLMLAREE